jgi:class 3 adenylate cyclase
MNLVLSKLGIKLRIGLDIIFLTLSIIASGLDNNPEFYTIFKLIIELIDLFLIVWRFDKDFNKLWFAWWLGLTYLISAILRLIDFSKPIEIIFPDFLLYILQACLCSQLIYSMISWCIVFVALIQIIVTVVVHDMDGQSIIASLVFLVTLLFIMFNREKKLRIFSRIKCAAEKELSNTEELLAKMMPKNVLEKLKEQSHVTEHISGVSILYADIAGFTLWSANKLPDEVVGMLSNLFTEFDYKCVEYGVYKVHTIGDCYVALGYTGSKVRSISAECYNLARFALQLVKTIEEVNEKHGISLGMRIGIHTGDIIGGIVGTNIVRYDIYGADVLMSNKMESTGKVGKVHISQETMRILSKHYPNEFVFVKAETVEAPIIQEDTLTYFLDLA